MSSAAGIKTRILVISDTHGRQPHRRQAHDAADTDDEVAAADLLTAPTGFRWPLAAADVAIHCGDLTQWSSLPEFESTFAMLRAIRAPLKLVIAGNHDVALDPSFWASHDGDADTPRAVVDIIARAREDGVEYLTEGSYSFTLANGARLSVYASQYTPRYGRWAFQYLGRHDFAIPPGVDIAVTHGPPLGILDAAGIPELSGLPRRHAGCESLFQAIHRAKPKMHCFGHIHEAWGSYLATWKPDSEVKDCIPSCGTVIDAANSCIETLSGLKPTSHADMVAMSDDKMKRLAQLSKQRGVHIDLTQGDSRLQHARQTLFLNAAIMDIRYRPTQLPWLVDIDLAKAVTPD